MVILWNDEIIRVENSYDLLNLDVSVLKMFNDAYLLNITKKQLKRSLNPKLAKQIERLAQRVYLGDLASKDRKDYYEAIISLINMDYSYENLEKLDNKELLRLVNLQLK